MSGRSWIMSAIWGCPLRAFATEIEVIDDPDTNMEDIVESLAKASLRTHTLIESIWNTMRSGVLMIESEQEEEEAV